MPQIKLNFSRLSIPEKIAKARQIITSIDGNPHFPTPQPTLSALTTATDELEAAAGEAQAARQTAKAKTTIQNQKEEVVDRLFSQESGYVFAVSGGDEAIIQSAGMDVRAAPGTVAISTAPLALSATAGDHDGQMDLSWDPVVGANSYVIEMSPDPPTAESWKHLGVSTKSTFIASGLTSGSRIWFRVAAVNPAGQSGWSDPATKIVP